jgi:hypothetical protein
MACECERACVYACVCAGARACVYVCNRACTYADACDRARAYVRAYVHMRRVMNGITITIHTNRLDLGCATNLNIEVRCAEYARRTSILRFAAPIRCNEPQY